MLNGHQARWEMVALVNELEWLKNRLKRNPRFGSIFRHGKNENRNYSDAQ